MIVRAKYTGPFDEVTIAGVTVKRGEAARIRVPDGQQLGGCWQVLDDEAKDDAGAAASSEGQASAGATTASDAPKKKGA